MISLHNHYQYFWNDVPYYFPERTDYKIKFGRTHEDLSFREAMIQNAKFIWANHGTTNLFLSGGWDS